MTWKSILLPSVALVGLGLPMGLYWPFGNHDEVLKLPGTVEIQEVRLGSKIGGRVASVAIAEGDQVEPGQPLVYFEVPELTTQYDQAKARLRQSQADYEKTVNGPRNEEKLAAKAAVDAAKARWQRLKAGYRIEEIDQAKSELATAEADLKRTQKDWERVVELYPRAASKAEYDAALAANGQNQGRVNAARARLKLLQTGSRVEDIAEAEAEVARLQANYDLLLAGSRSEDIAQAAGRAAEARARVAELEANLKESVVAAPEKAVVEVLAVRKGDVMAPNQPVVRVLRAADLWVKAYVPETQLGKVRLNQQVEVTIDSYPDKKFQGVVTQIASSSEFTPRNVQSADERKHQVFAIKVHVPDPEGVFKSGMAAEVVLPLKAE